MFMDVRILQFAGFCSIVNGMVEGETNKNRVPSHQYTKMTDDTKQCFANCTLNADNCSVYFQQFCYDLDTCVLYSTFISLESPSDIKCIVVIRSHKTV